MTRYENIADGGYYPFPHGTNASKDWKVVSSDKTYIQAVANLIAPSTHGGRMLDGTAGEGDTLLFLSKAWGLDAFGIELGGDRAGKLVSRLGFHRGLNEDFMNARITPGSFVVQWNNPPYMHESGVGRGKRVEQRFVEFAARYIQRAGGIHLIALYNQHLSKDLAFHLYSTYESVTVFSVPGAHLRSYGQIVIVAQAGKFTSSQPERDARKMEEQAQANWRSTRYDRQHPGAEKPSDKDMSLLWPSLLDVTEPLYEIPATSSVRGNRKFRFTPNLLTKEMILESALSVGLHESKGFLDLFQLDRGVEDIRPLMLPRARQFAGLLAAGMFNGLDLETEEARCLVRSVVRSKTVSVGQVEDENGELLKESFRIVPETAITLLYENGDVQDITGDDDICKFITDNKHAMINYAKESFRPVYKFDYVGGRYESHGGKRVRILGQLERFVRSVRIKKGEESLSLYPAQRHVISAAYTHLTNNRAVIISGEPGVGKTAIGSSLMEAFRFRTPEDPFYQELYAPLSKNRAARRKHHPMRPDQFNIVICPPHLVRKWKREILSINPDAFVFTIASGENTKPIEELRIFIEQVDQQPADTMKILLMSREMFKAAEGSSAAYNIKKKYGYKVVNTKTLELAIGATEIPICPTTGAELIDRTDNEGVIRYMPIKRLENRRHFTGLKPGKKSERGISPLRYQDGAKYFDRYESDPDAPENWRNIAQNEAKQAQIEFARLNPDAQALWQEERTYSSVQAQTGKTVRAALKSAMGTLVEPFPFPDLTSAHLQEFQYRSRKNARAPFGGIARLLAKRYGDRIYMLIADEVHELKSDDSAQGIAFTQLANAATRVVNMTGTLYGGEASSLYVIEYITNPRIRRNYNWEDGGGERWIDDMGVREFTMKYGESVTGKDGITTAKKAKKSSSGEAPGASPKLLYEIVDHIIPISISDLGSALPDLEEMGIPIQMDASQAAIYIKADGELTGYLNDCKANGDNSFLGAYFQSRLNWANYPFEDYPVIHRRTVIDPETEEETLVTDIPYIIPGMGHDYITAKERWLLDVVKEELAQGRGVGIYARQTGDKSDGGRNTGQRLVDLITREISEAKVAHLTSKVDSGKREEWLDQRKDCNVLVCNPNLVKTGLDLLQFPTFIWHEIDYSLYTVIQASGRARRPGQTKECRVIFSFFHLDFVTEVGEDGETYYVTDEAGQRVPAADTVEAKGIVIVDRKRAAAAFLLGNEAGSLSALTDGGGKSLISELAKAMSDESVIDASAMFRKAAVTEEEIWEADAEEDETPNRAEAVHCDRESEISDLIATILNYAPGADVALTQLKLF